MPERDVSKAGEMQAGEATCIKSEQASCGLRSWGRVTRHESGYTPGRTAILLAQPVPASVMAGWGRRNCSGPLGEADTGIKGWKFGGWRRAQDARLDHRKEVVWASTLRKVLSLINCDSIFHPSAN